MENEDIQNAPIEEHEVMGENPPEDAQDEILEDEEEELEYIEQRPIIPLTIKTYQIFLKFGDKIAPKYYIEFATDGPEEVLKRFKKRHKVKTITINYQDLPGIVDGTRLISDISPSLYKNHPLFPRCQPEFIIREVESIEVKYVFDEEEMHNKKKISPLRIYKFRYGDKDIFYSQYTAKIIKKYRHESHEVFIDGVKIDTKLSTKLKPFRELYKI